jgi:ABC-type transport system involved in cytochrome c biogenesis permease component
MFIKPYTLFKDELSLSRFRGALIQSSLLFSPLFLCFSIIKEIALPQTVPFFILYLFNPMVLMTLIPFCFYEDVAEGYLSWLKGREQLLRFYFVAKLMGGILLLIAPCLMLSGIGLWLSEGQNMTFQSWGLFSLNALLSYTTLLCWGNLFQLLIGGSFKNDGMSMGVSLLSLLVLPLMVPTFIVGLEFINVLAHGDFWGYYLGMQGGLLMASFFASLGLVPLVIKHTEWD